MNGREESMSASKVTKLRTTSPSSTSMRKPQESKTWGELEECTMRKNGRKEEEARKLMRSGTDRATLNG
jgi:hypothetical protein